MNKLRFSTAILTLVLLLLILTSLMLLVPAYLGSQSALQQEFELTQQRDQHIIDSFLAEQFDSIRQTGLELTYQPTLISAHRQNDAQLLSHIITDFLSSSRGQRIDAIILEDEQSHRLIFKNANIIENQIILPPQDDQFNLYNNWYSKKHKQNLFFQLKLPIIDSTSGRVTGNVYIVTVINNNYWLMNSLQNLFAAKALGIYQNNQLIAGIENKNHQLDLLNQTNEFTNGVMAKHKNLLRKHQLFVDHTDKVTMKLLFPNNAVLGLRDTYSYTLSKSAFFVLCLGLATIFLLHKLMRNSLKQIITYAENVPQSGASTPFKHGRFEEFMRVGKAIEGMLDRVRDRDKKLASILDNSPNLVFIKDLEHKYQLVNKRFAHQLNLSPEEMINAKDTDILSKETIQLVQESDQKVLLSQKPTQYELTFSNEDGSNSTYLMSKFPIFNDLGQTHAIGAIAADISEIKSAQQQIALTHQVFAATAEAILIIDNQHNIISSNQALLDMSGVQTDEQLSIFIKTFINKHPAIKSALLSSTQRWQGECTLINSNGIHTPVLASATPLSESNNPSHVIIFTDISQLKAAEQRLEHIALYDSLTGLPNRALFHQRLITTISQFQSGSFSCILLIDLDRFKAINDTYGHNLGDQLLQQAAQRLQQCVKSRDTISRLGGDEFALIIQESRSLDMLESIAHRVLVTLREPYLLSGHQCFTSASIGIAIIGDDGLDSNTLTKHADLAMYQAKEHGRNNIQFFDQTINQKNQLRNEFEKGLRVAITKKELYLNYQPKFDITGKHVKSTEALLRWNFSGSGMVSPATFIPIAEDSGLIIEIGRFVLNQACKAAAKWLDDGYKIPVSVNLSPRQLCDPQLLPDLECALSSYNLPADMLELEITETHVMENIDQVIPILQQIRAMGISLSIDDFGTGYSSLMYLKKLPVNTIKIDRSFVMDIPGKEDDEALIQAIIQMSHSLRLKVVAEGIETQAQQQFLKELGCDELQGFLLAKPGSVEQLLSHAQKTEPA